MYHLSVKTISRSAGRSATAAAAYRSGELIADERTGEVHDYTRKQGVEYTEIVLPAGAPAWSDRAALWNAAEAAETRKNSTVAREFELAIPKELTREEGIALVREFTQALVDKHRFAADIAIHKDDPRKWDGTEKGFICYHAHILVTTRRLTADGFTEKTRELDAIKSGGVDQVKHWREQWAIFANRALEKAGHDQRIDHRSLADQGIDREPTLHLGPAATQHIRRGKKSEFAERVKEEKSDRERLREKLVHEQQSLMRHLKLVDQALDALHELQHRKKEIDQSNVKVQLAAMPVHQQVEVHDLLRKRIEEQRNKRLEKALSRAQKREARRRKLQELLDKREPKLEQGFMVKLKSKTHNEAHETWRKIQDKADRSGAVG